MRVYYFRELRIRIESPIYLMLLGMLAIQVAAPLQLNVIMSFGTWLIFLSSILAIIVTVGTQKWNNRYLLAVIALVLTIFLSIMYSFDLSYQSIVAALCFLEIPLFMGSYSNINNGHIRKTIYTFFVVLSVYYIILSFTSLANIYYSEYGAKQMQFLTLGYKNPNETAMYLFACLIVLIALLLELKHIAAKIFVVIDIALILRLLWLTLSRTGILISVLFLVAVIYFRQKRVPRFVRVISIMAPIVFFWVMLLFGEWLSGWSILGETMETGRMEIYRSALEDLNFATFLVGQYSFHFPNLHNGFLSIFATVGLFGTMVFFWFINAKLRDVEKRIKTMGPCKVALIGLLCIVAYTSTEAAFLTSGSALAAAVISIYLLGIFDDVHIDSVVGEVVD